jgi:sulfur carrier protein
MTIKLFLNGTQQLYDLEQLDLISWLAAAGYRDGFFAVAINHEFIPRSLYHTVILKDGDEVDVVVPMQGG